jgi:catechol 2,3-dioxygenase-like lactoylglutathione lyase family enzyme
MTRVLAIDHVQLAMPPGGEDAARRFYAGLLGVPEVAKPEHLAKRGGCWFELGAVRIHLGVDSDFRPAKRAHPALIVEDLTALAAKLDQGGFSARPGDYLEGYDRLDVDDPFGNRIELMQPKSSA